MDEPQKSSAEELAHVGELLRITDEHLVDVLTQRMALARVVEHIKTASGNGQPIFRADIEDDRLAHIREIAIMRGLNPHFVEAMLYFVIDESCKIQMSQRESSMGSYQQSVGDMTYDELKGNLIQLCAEVASSYDADYSRTHPATEIYLEFERDVIRKTILELEPTHRLRALDIGCGTGLASFELARYFDHVEGVDLSRHMVQQAQTNAVRLGEISGVVSQVRPAGWSGNDVTQPLFTARTSFMFGDVEEVHYWRRHKDASIDFVVMSMGTGSDFRKLQLVIDEVRRILRPGGRFVFSFYNANSLASKFPVLPWAPSLAATYDGRRECLDVHAPERIYSLYAQAYTLEEIEDMMRGSVSIIDSYTCPVVSPTYPPSVFTDESFRKKIGEMDHTLAGEAQQGAYLLVTGRKS